jgi:aryl-alcohol dehydrogenase-like predicted oxidoreductase
MFSSPAHARSVAPSHWPPDDRDVWYRIPIERVKAMGYGPGMRTRRLGMNGPQLSVIGFGALEVGLREGTWREGLSDEDVLNIIRAAPDAGIDWIDTAEVYGDGNSERLVGRALVGRRDDVLIATKVAEQAENYGGTGFRPEEIRAACDASLERLRTDRIDLYQLHWWPRDGERVPIEETWGAMAGLVEEGKVRFIGVSNFDQCQIRRCLAVRHVDALQAQFSPVTPALADLFTWCGEQGIGVLAYGPLGYGLIRPALPTVQEMTEMLGDLLGPKAPERWGSAALELLREIHPIAERLGAPLSHVALAWNLAQPGVTSVIAGSSNPDHIHSNAQAGDVQLDDDTVNEIDALVARYRRSGVRPHDPFDLGRGLEGDTRS